MKDRPVGVRIPSLRAVGEATGGEPGSCPSRASIVFLEVVKTYSSNFEEHLVVRGVETHGFRVLKVRSENVPDTIAGS